MKKLLVLVLLPYILTFSQELYVGELRIDLINYGGSFNVTFLLTSIGARWDENYNLTEDFSTASDVVSGYPYYGAFDHVLDPSNVNDTFAVGLYKISAIENSTEQAYFYMDWRSSDWSASLDVNFKYNVGNNDFRDWDNTQTIDKTYQTLWDLTNNELQTTGLEEYWDNCLALIPSVNNNPRLIWGPYPESVDLSGYNIYRKVGAGSFTLIHFNSDSQHEYIDTDYSITEPTGTQLQYYVRAVYVEDGTSSPTNTVTTQGMTIEKDSYKNSLKYNEYSLSPNYPNPFNPSTNINYSLPENSFVTLKVYDVLGREVVTLANEYKGAGNYSVVFNALDLPSGVYFYKIQIGGFTNIRKMVLQK